MTETELLKSAIRLVIKHGEECMESQPVTESDVDLSFCVGYLRSALEIAEKLEFERDTGDG